MVALILSTTIISCSQAIQLIDNVVNVVGLNNQQKTEIIKEIKKIVPSCPVIVKENKNAKPIKKSSNWPDAWRPSYKKYWNSNDSKRTWLWRGVGRFENKSYRVSLFLKTMTSYYLWFGIFIFVFYLVATDDSVAYAFLLVSKIIKFQYEKTKWWLLNNPRNPVVKWLMWKRALKLAKELEKEFKKWYN